MQNNDLPTNLLQIYINKINCHVYERSSRLENGFTDVAVCMK